MGNIVRVTTLPAAEHAFLEELITRVVHQGLLDPHELQAASIVWSVVHGAPARQITPPAAPEAPQEGEKP